MSARPFVLIFVSALTSGVVHAAAGTDVPAHAFDIILGRPSGTSVTASVLSYENLEGYLEYHIDREVYGSRTPVVRLTEGTPVEIRLDALRPDARYYYRLRYRTVGDSQPFWQAEEGTFRTQRKPGSAFRFTVQADSALGEKVSTDLYAHTLDNAAAARPDFHIELGRAFTPDARTSSSQYLAQRYYFGALCRSAPLFLASAPEKFFPNPRSDGFYSWEWGDALFVVISPEGVLSGEMLAGIRRTLEDSHAPLQFVFTHSRPGDTRKGREFHQLMVKQHVHTVFHGHDHAVAKEEADGVIYQSVPQPGNPRAPSGHLAVSVKGREVRVKFVRTETRLALASLRVDH